MANDNEPHTDDDNQVGPENACPTCHERDADQLVWDEAGERVTCSRCGTTYDPAAPAGAADPSTLN